jgi:hypothetical protein
MCSSGVSPIRWHHKKKKKVVFPEGLAAASAKVTQNIKKTISHRQQTRPQGM